MKNWLFCNICGDFTPADADLSDWIVGPYVKDPSRLVIRCPAHWGEWPLRIAGITRSTELLAKGRELAARAAAAPPRVTPRNVRPVPVRDEAYRESRTRTRL